MASTVPGAPAKRRGRPPKVTRAQIVAAAVGVGLDRFSMQEVAEVLGVSTPALYSHVASRDELVGLAASGVLGDIGVSLGQHTDWKRWLTDWALALRERLGQVGPGLIEALPIDAAGVGAAERGIVLMVEAGFAPSEAGQALWLMTRLAATSERHVGAAAPTVGAARDALDAGPSPTMAAAMDGVEALDADAAFAFDIAVILEGLERVRSTRAPGG